MIDVETARRLTLQFLAGNPTFGQGVNDQVDDIERSAAGHAGTLTPEDKSKIHEVIWDLVVQRVLTVESKGSYKWAFLRLTDFGKDVVTEQRWSPYDPDGYLKELKGQSPKVFNLCELYVAEALSCFRGGSYIAASVMLGAASEGAMNNLFHCLAAAMRANGQMHEVDDYERKLNREASFYKKYELFKRHFDGVRLKLPGKLTDDLDGQMTGVFLLIRYYRNEAGHPTKTEIERTAVLRNLTLFVHYCKRIEEIADWLESNPDKLI